MNRLLFTAKRKDGKGYVFCGSIIQFYDNGALTAFMPDMNSKCVTTHDVESNAILDIQSCQFHEVDPETIFVGPPMTFAQVDHDFTADLKRRYTQLVIENAKLRKRIRELEGRN